jgi:hypothetical protein
MKRSEQRKRRGAKAKRNHKKPERAVNIAELAPKTNEIADKHEEKAYEHPAEHGKQNAEKNGGERKTYRMNAVLSVLFLSVLGLIVFAFAFHYWQQSNYTVALRWAFGTYIFFGLGIAFAVQYYVVGPIEAARRTAKASQESPESSLEKSLRDSNRAWVVVELQLNGPITFDARGALVRFALRITNTGNSPALKVNMYPKIINQQNPDTVGEQRRICGVLPDGSNTPGSHQISWGITLFPGPDHAETQFYVLTVSPEELGRSKDFDGYFKGKIMLHILGCVEYAIDPSGERHHTFFSYSVMTTTPGKNDFIEMNRDMPLNSIFVSKDSRGWGAT